MKRKTAVRQNLEEIPVYIQDNSDLSPDYFQISEFPLRLTAGKNLFKLRGKPDSLRIGSSINIEVLDYNGDPIYSEIISYVDEDKSRVVAIYIYEDSAPGDAVVNIVGEASQVPAEWRDKPNIRWTRTVPVNPVSPNASEIIFEEDPQVTVQEQVSVQLDRSYTISQFPQYSTGTIQYQSLNNTPVAVVSGGKFNTDMKGGTLTVASPQNPKPTALYTISNTSYSATIKKVLSDSIIELETPYIGYSSKSLSEHIYTEFEPSSYTIDYEETPTYVPTQNSESVAIVEIKGLEPATGDVSRIKIYTSGKGTVGTWELANDIELIETEIFVPSTSSVDPDISVGSFVSQSIIDTYWRARTFQGRTETTAPTVTWSTSSLSNAAAITSATDITAKNSVHLFQVSESFAGEFIKDSQYKVQFDAFAEKASTSSNRAPKLYVYASGSAFNYDVTDYYNQELGVNIGKRIGQLDIAGAAVRVDDYEINFKADNTGTAVLIFVIDSGDWQLSDIRTTTDNDPGYTPNYTRIRTEIPTKHKAANQLSFKIEYYNVAGTRSKLISYVYNKTWQGGNRYIDGDYSMLTGSLYVADTLESGVAISGYKNTGYVRSLGYDGFAAGNPGFLLWSGSALSGSAGTKGGVPYSGVGLELYADADNYFRYSTDPSELDVRTKTFFLGDPATQYISGSAGNLEISSSGFFLNANGDVTASSLIAVNGSDVLFDTNSEFVDGVNVGRVVYFDQSEYSINIADLPANATPTTTTGSNVAGPSFHMFILPGETRMQVSYTAEIDYTSGTATKTFYLHTFIANAITGSSTTTNTYGKFDSQAAVDPSKTLLASVAVGDTRTGADTLEYTSNEITNRQGIYVLVHTTAAISSTAGTPTGTIKLKNFVFRTSRKVGSAINPPPSPLAES
jgi:hypothetical protein